MLKGVRPQRLALTMRQSGLCNQHEETSPTLSAPRPPRPSTVGHRCGLDLDHDNRFSESFMLDPYDRIPSPEHHIREDSVIGLDASSSDAVLANPTSMTPHPPTIRSEKIGPLLKN